MNLFIVNTPYHIMVSKLMIQENDRIIVIDDFKLDESEYCNYLLDTCFKTNKPRVIKGVRSFRRSKIQLYFYISSQGRRIKGELSKKTFDNIILFTDTHPIVQKILSIVKYRKNVCVYEEGIGLYRDVRKRGEFMYKLLGKLYFGKYYSNHLRIGEHPLVRSIYCNYPMLLSEGQKTKTTYPMIELDFNRLKEFQTEQIEENTFHLFISQPLVEDGAIEMGKYVKFLRQYILSLDLRDEVFYIKPHPRESLDKYQSMLMDNIKFITNKDIPVEMLLINKKDVKIYTIYSSAVFNIMKYFKYKTYMLYKIFYLEPDIPKTMIEMSGITVLKRMNTIRKELKI